MSLTPINIAKIIHWLPIKDKNHTEMLPFSMNDVKTPYSNKLYLYRIIAKFGINPKLGNNKRKIMELLNFGKTAA